MTGLGDPPAWAAAAFEGVAGVDDGAAVRRWEQLSEELLLPFRARPAAETWLAAWAALRAAQDVNRMDGAEQIPLAPLVGALRLALAEVEKHAGKDGAAGNLRIVR